MIERRLWTPSDASERPRIVRVLRVVYAQGRVLGAVVIEDGKRLPGVAFVEDLLEIGRVIRDGVRN